MSVDNSEVPQCGPPQRLSWSDSLQLVQKHIITLSESKDKTCYILLTHHREKLYGFKWKSMYICHLKCLQWFVGYLNKHLMTNFIIILIIIFSKYSFRAFFHSKLVKTNFEVDSLLSTLVPVCFSTLSDVHPVSSLLYLYAQACFPVMDCNNSQL